MEDMTLITKMKSEVLIHYPREFIKVWERSRRSRKTFDLLRYKQEKANLFISNEISA